MTINSASIILTETCNMSCSFCYEKGGNCGLISKQILEKALDYLTHNRVKERLSILWFGGEPLLAFDLLQYGVGYLKNISPDQTTHSISTNCTIWDQKIEKFFLKYPDVKLQLSWLGLPEFQNSYRGQADLVERNIRQIVASGIINPIQIQIQVTPQIASKLVETIDYIYNVTGDRCEIYIRPIPEAEGWMKNSVLEKFSEDMFYLCQKYSNVLTIVHNIMGGRISDILYCNFGKNFVTIAPLGDIYPCHRSYFQRDENLRLGNIQTGIIKSRFSDTLKQSSRASIIGCSNCLAYDYCYVCPMCNYEESNSFFIPTDQICAVNKAFVMGISKFKDQFNLPIPNKVNIILNDDINETEMLVQMAQIIMKLEQRIAIMGEEIKTLSRVIVK